MISLNNVMGIIRRKNSIISLRLKQTMTDLFNIYMSGDLHEKCGLDL